MNDVPHFTLQLRQMADYAFRVDFDLPDVAPLQIDDPAPLGRAIQLACTEATIPHLQHSLRQFEDFCIVTATLRQALRIDVVVADCNGRPLWASNGDAPQQAA